MHFIDTGAFLYKMILILPGRIYTVLYIIARLARCNVIVMLQLQLILIHDQGLAYVYTRSTLLFQYNSVDDEVYYNDRKKSLKDEN